MRKRKRDLVAQLFHEIRFVVLDIERVQREVEALANLKQCEALGSTDGSIVGTRDEQKKYVLLAYARGLRDAAARFDATKNLLLRTAPLLHGPPRLVVDNENKTPAVDAAGGDNKATAT